MSAAGSRGPERWRPTILMLSVDEAHHLAYSLPAALAQGAHQVLVIDNACSDRTESLVEELGARCIHLRKRLSYCAAINAGIAASDGDAVLLLNADCVLEAAFLESALRRLREPGVGSVAPRLYRAHGLERSERLEVVDTVGMTIDRRRKNGLVGHNAARHSYTTRGEVFGGDGAAVLYRRETLVACAVGGEVLDEDFELWASDADLAWRAQLLGWRCVYEPAAVGWHKRFYSPSTRAGLAPEHRRMQFRNRLLMIAKNESARDLLRDLPAILTYEALALGHALLRERSLLAGYGEALRLWPAARRRRRQIQPFRDRSRRVPFGLRAQR